MNIATLEQAHKDMEHGVYDKTDNGKCTQCGACCSNLLPMTDKEITVIRNYIKKHHIKECNHSIPLAKPALDMTCPFLDTSKSEEKCTIYSVRPAICRCFICSEPKGALKHTELLQGIRKAGSCAGDVLWKRGIRMSEETRQKIQKIAQTYGYEPQSRQCIEEMAELTQAINKYWRKDLQCGKFPYCPWDGYMPMDSEEYNNLIEELADVQIMIWQMKFLLTADDFDAIVQQKINRQMERIEKK